jgi:E3 ubiquitin-protein ligase UBR1
LFVDVDAFPFKSKRFMPVFSDLRYLCHNEPVQEMIAQNREFMSQFVKTCRLFMCINPNKRAARSHVEYETDAWISVFNVTLSLSRVIKVYGEAYGRGTPEHLLHGINVVVHQILLICSMLESKPALKIGPIVTHDVQFGDLSYHTVDFDVLEGWVSFHHSLHWLLAELFKHVDLLANEKMRNAGVVGGIGASLIQHFGEMSVLTLIDYPLRGKRDELLEIVSELVLILFL